MTSESTTPTPTFRDLPLIEPVQQALEDMGHVEPTPIQAALIEHLAQGRDVVGQAQTGTGKTGAFALPILSTLDPELRDPQALILTPTRELAMQVAKAIEQYGANMQGLKVLAVYGGSDYVHQFKRLNRGVHVVVGTPGRIMDHMRKGALILDDLSTLVLDEADEMLRMGFIEDVEWILEQTPEERQVALFSATMPPQVRKIALNYLREPEQVTIKSKTSTVENTRQRYILVDEMRKNDALSRVLEGEPTDGVIVFVRTKTQTTEVAEDLVKRGFKAAALNGDMMQDARERTVGRLRKGRLDVLVATDVAARGLDIDRLSHVVNYDIPYDPEAYVHRIGRTGRAGRSGEAILLVTPEQRRTLRIIEHSTKQRLEQMDPPDVSAINEQRIARFKEKITSVRGNTKELGIFADVVSSYCAEHDVPELEVAAALARMAHAYQPMLLDELPEVRWNSDRPQPGTGPRHARNQRPVRRSSPLEQGFERYRVSVGNAHNVKPGNLVGAIANEAGLQGRAIGRIDIHDEFSLIDLPEGMPDHVLQKLQRVQVFGVALQMEKFEGEAPPVQERRPGGYRGRPGGHGGGHGGRRPFRGKPGGRKPRD